VIRARAWLERGPADADGTRANRVPKLRRRLTFESGMTVIELIVAMSILLITLGAIVDAFASATKAESDQVARADAQENARLALETMRRDIHCATGSDTSVVGKLTLTEPTLPCAQGAAVATITWCTTATAGHYVLRRSPTASCNSASVPKADFLATNAVWSDAACVTGSGKAKAVAVDLQVSVTGHSTLAKTYRLLDAITLRNGLLLC
jgi:Tfp pilus assembly protein PilW